MPMTNDRWFFKNPNTGRVSTLEGDPTQHPGWVRWGHDLNSHGCVRQPREKHRYAVLFLDGVEQWGRLLVGTQRDGVICNRNCETAKNPRCTCQCGGKNHGISHKIEADRGRDESEF